MYLFNKCHPKQLGSRWGLFNGSKTGETFPTFFVSVYVSTKKKKKWACYSSLHTQTEPRHRFGKERKFYLVTGLENTHLSFFLSFLRAIYDFSTPEDRSIKSQFDSVLLLFYFIFWMLSPPRLAACIWHRLEVLFSLSFPFYFPFTVLGSALWAGGATHPISSPALSAVTFLQVNANWKRKNTTNLGI